MTEKALKCCCPMFDTITDEIEKIRFTKQLFKKFCKEQILYQ